MNAGNEMGAREKTANFTETFVLLRPTTRFDEPWLIEQIRGITGSTNPDAPHRLASKLWVLDLSQVAAIDSSGLVALANGFQAANTYGARFVICGLSPAVRLILEITQLDRVFTVVDTYETLLKETEELERSAPCPSIV